MGKIFKYGTVPQHRIQYKRCAIIDTAKAPKYGHSSTQSLFDSAISKANDRSGLTEPRHKTVAAHSPPAEPRKHTQMQAAESPENIQMAENIPVQNDHKLEQAEHSQLERREAVELDHKLEMAVVFAQEEAGRTVGSHILAEMQRRIPRLVEAAAAAAAVAVAGCSNRMQCLGYSNFKGPVHTSLFTTSLTNCFANSICSFVPSICTVLSVEKSPGVSQCILDHNDEDVGGSSDEDRKNNNMSKIVISINLLSSLFGKFDAIGRGRNVVVGRKGCSPRSRRDDRIRESGGPPAGSWGSRGGRGSTTMIVELSLVVQPGRILKVFCHQEKAAASAVKRGEPEMKEAEAGVKKLSIKPSTIKGLIQHRPSIQNHSLLPHIYKSCHSRKSINKVSFLHERGP
ncbi:hypothetical protein M5K25_026038 [Dendrobium thyrsiflorum]|uniref:Uncharacterized protein n=1 Tax=Dendrobium thyrsiflorum TaxID=117978 RepID=A0ABD0TWN8_DENTH